MSYHRVLPPLPIAPLNGHNPDVASQEFSFLRPSVMTNQATIQASKSNATKQSSLISENLGLKRETTSPSTESLEDEEESPKRARSSSPTFVSKENSQQVRGRPSMRSESKEGPTLLQGESPTSEVCLCQPDPKVPRPRNGMLSLNFLFLFDFNFDFVSQLSRMNLKLLEEELAKWINSIHSLSTASSISSRRAESRPLKSRYFQSHRRTLEVVILRSSNPLEKSRRGRPCSKTFVRPSLTWDKFSKRN